MNGSEGKVESAKPHEHGEKNNMRRWSSTSPCNLRFAISKVLTRFFFFWHSCFAITNYECLNF